STSRAVAPPTRSAGTARAGCANNDAATQPQTVAAPHMPARRLLSLLLFLILSLPTLAWADDEPVATAPIPPPLPAAPPKAEHPTVRKPPAVTAVPSKPKQRAAAKHHRRKLVVAHRPARHVRPPVPHFAAMPPRPRSRYYEELVPVPDEGDGPAMPPPWY